LILRKYVPEILAAYRKWCANQTDNKALIIYDTMWHSTEKIANAIQDAFEELGVETRMYNLQYNHISDIMTEVLTARYICVGSPTLNNNIMPTVASFLTYMKGLAPKDRVGLAFGSYGWGGQSVGIVDGILKECGYNMFDMIRLQYIPSPAVLDEVKTKLIAQIKEA
jgi:flavorubredoxin